MKHFVPPGAKGYNETFCAAGGQRGIMKHFVPLGAKGYNETFIPPGTK